MNKLTNFKNIDICSKSNKENKDFLNYERNIKEKAYVVNLHILEACNYRCKYCFAHFDHMDVLPVATWKHIVNNIVASIPVKRFNIAGGEPMLYPHLEELIKYIKDLGVEVSIITNGSLLTEDFILRNKDLIDIIGISIDSFNANTLLSLGCNTKTGEIITPEKFLNIAKIIKENHIILKVNTVVSSLNCQDNLNNIFKDIGLDRWKILKMKIFKNEEFNNSFLDITNDEFNDFVIRHKNISNIIVESSLKNSYIIIDSSGSLVDNSDDDYRKIIDVSVEDFKIGFEKLNLDRELYFSRY